MSMDAKMYWKMPTGSGWPTHVHQSEMRRHLLIWAFIGRMRSCILYYSHRLFTYSVEWREGRKSARWTLNDYARTTSVTSLQSQLNWQTLEERRSVARLCLFYKIVNGLVAVPLPDYMQPTHRISRYCHSMTFRQIHTGKDYYKYSFFPLAIVQWNALPANVAVAPSLEIFKAAVGQLQHPKP